MGIFDRLERSAPRADQGALPFDDPRLWMPYGGDYGDTFSGFTISTETVTRVSTVFACVSLKGETIGSLPCHLYRRLDNGGRERAKDHPWYRPVRYQPTAQHTAIDFFSSSEARVNLRGISLAEIQQRRTGNELLPIRGADILQVDQLESNRLRFQVQDPVTRKTRTLLQNEVLFVRDFMEDGFAAKARASLAREAIAVAAAAEGYVGRFFKYDATGRLVITHPTALNETQRAEWRKMMAENQEGWANRSKYLHLSNGVTATELGKQQDSDFIISPRQFQVADIARYFGRIPLFMIGLEEKSTTWGTGIEQQKQGWIDFGMMPSIVRHEQAMNRDLLLPEEQDEYFFEFNLDGLLRGDSKTRAETNEIKKRNGAINANEWRVSDNMNPRDDPGGDAYQDTVPGASPNPPPPPPPAGSPPATAGRFDGLDVDGNPLPAPIARGTAEGGRPAEPPPASTSAAQAGAASPAQVEPVLPTLPIPAAVPAPPARAIPVALVADAAARIALAETGAIQRRATKAKADPQKWMAWVTKHAAADRSRVVGILAPLVAAAGLEPWVADEVAIRVERTAVSALAAGVPAGWLEQRETEVATIITETVTAGAAARAA